MEISRETVIERLRRYVDMPSGSRDLEGLAALSALVEADMRALGFEVVRYSADGVGSTLECTYGNGPHTLLLLGHMDTVFERAQSQPLQETGEDTVRGSGVMDMKGGLLIMQDALARALPCLPKDARIVCVISGDEEIGAAHSRAVIERCAKDAFACLCFEPKRESGALVRSRKGTLSFTVRCTGISGHAGAAYLQSASAIQQLCKVVGDLYALRDDACQISVNVGVIEGGSAVNVVCGEAHLRGEVRYYNPAYTQELTEALHRIAQTPGVPGTSTELTLHASHPPFEANEKGEKLLALARRVGEELGIPVTAEDTGGSGDVAFASMQGAASLDGLGLHGGGMHTLEETGTISSYAPAVRFAERLIRRLFEEQDKFM